MLKSNSLKEEIMAYRRLKKEVPEKNYNGLLDIMDRHLVLAHQRKNRSAQVRASNQRNITTTVVLGVCRKFPLGKCGRKNCNQEHPNGQGDARKNKSKGDNTPKGGKSKGKGGSKGKSLSPSRDKRIDRTLPCPWFQSGNMPAQGLQV